MSAPRLLHIVRKTSLGFLLIGTGTTMFNYIDCASSAYSRTAGQCIEQAIQGTLFFAFLAVVCTFGFGLVIILFASWVIGSLALAAYHLIRYRGAPPSSRITPKQRAILTYLWEAQQKGMGKEMAREHLLQAGWSEVAIQDAIEAGEEAGGPAA